MDKQQSIFIIEDEKSVLKYIFTNKKVNCIINLSFIIISLNTLDKSKAKKIVQMFFWSNKVIAIRNKFCVVIVFTDVESIRMILKYGINE